jgi:60 kDa SS-A/Ro ribonucleoprotein
VEPIPGSTQVPNATGGYAFPVDDWVRLDRFLILASEGGSYYAGRTTGPSAATARSANSGCRRRQSVADGIGLTTAGIVPDPQDSGVGNEMRVQSPEGRVLSSR